MNNSYALLVIDMQNGFINEKSPHHIKGAKETVPLIADVIKKCRETDIPVFFITRSYNENGTDVEHTRYESWIDGGRPMSARCPVYLSDKMPDEFEECDKDFHIIKPRFSAFFHTELDLILRRLGINSVVLTGTTTPNCIRATCYDAISLEYNVAVIEDCTSSVTKDIQQANILDMRNIGAQILTSDEFIDGIAVEDNVSKVNKAVLEKL